MSEEEFFNAMDMNMDLSFLHSVESPENTSLKSDSPTNCANEFSTEYDTKRREINLLDSNVHDDDGGKFEHNKDLLAKSPSRSSQISRTFSVTVPPPSPSSSSSLQPPPPPPPTTTTTTTTKSLAAWTFNKKKRKRVYVSLTGQKLTGQEAVRQCRQGFYCYYYVMYVVCNTTFLSSSL
jgi:hypothetical protein